MALEDDLLAAADTLVEAWHLLRGGHIERTVRLADDAVELALKTVIPLPDDLRPAPGREVQATHIYRYRREQADKLFRIPRHVLRRLHDRRLVDRFREAKVGGDQRVLTEAEAIESLGDATGIFETILRSSLISSDLAERVLLRLARRNELTVEEELLDLVEHNVGWGHYNLALRARLLRLESAFSLRPSEVGILHRARVVTLRAHMAMNEGSPQGTGGAIDLAQKAEQLWRDHQDPQRIVHTLKIQSIGWRMLETPEHGLRLMDDAWEVAADSRGLQDEVRSEQSALLGLVGDADAASRVLSDTLDRAHVDGKIVLEARTLQQIGKAQMLAGRLVEAEVTLLRGQGLLPPDYVIAECVGANTLAELYAKIGEKREAHFWAERVKHLAQGLGFEHQLKQLTEMMAKYPTIW